MLDVMRNPALDITIRKAKLKELLGAFETAFKGFPKLDARQVSFAESLHEIDVLRGDVFEGMIAVDANGNLTQKGQRSGTLRELMANVQATNAAYRRHGIEEEFVISISSPKDPTIPRELKVLTRKPKVEDPLIAPGRKKHTPVDPSDQSEDGVVVDIGVGLGDYARDVGGEQGQVVKTEYGPSYADPAMVRRDLAWEHTAPHVDADSVVVLGDALQTLPMLFAERSVKRLFINNINANYIDGAEEYLVLARGLREVMKSGGRVEVQWTTALETTGGKTGPRGHITGEGLKQALGATANEVPRSVSTNEDAVPVTDHEYSVSAPRGKSGVPSKTPPSNPVPERRWIFTFGE